MMSDEHKLCMQRPSQQTKTDIKMSLTVVVSGWRDGCGVPCFEQDFTEAGIHALV